MSKIQFALWVSSPPSRFRVMVDFTICIMLFFLYLYLQFFCPSNIWKKWKFILVIYPLLLFFQSSTRQANGKRIIPWKNTDLIYCFCLAKSLAKYSRKTLSHSKYKILLYPFNPKPAGVHCSCLKTVSSKERVKPGFLWLLVFS